MIAFTVARAAGNKRVKLEHFMPQRKKVQRRQTAEEQRAMFLGLAGKRIKRRKKS